MEKHFTFFLIICLLLNICGCYANNRIVRENYSHIFSNLEKELIIELKDRRTIISKAYEDFGVKKPSEFIFGKADIFDGISLTANIGTTLLISQIDSMVTGYSVRKDLICYSGGKRYFFSDGNYLYITKDTDPGFWIKGKIEESDSNFYGGLEPDEIINIGVNEINVVTTVFFIDGVTLINPLIIGAIVISSNPPLEDLDMNLN